MICSKCGSTVVIGTRDGMPAIDPCGCESCCDDCERVNPDDYCENCEKLSEEHSDGIEEGEQNRQGEIDELCNRIDGLREENADLANRVIELEGHIADV